MTNENQLLVKEKWKQHYLGIVKMDRSLERLKNQPFSEQELEISENSIGLLGENK